MSKGLRDHLRAYLPSWLADNYPASPSYGFRVLWGAVGLLVDLTLQVALEGSRAAVGTGTPTALKYIGEARGIIRGRNDTDADYVAKLRTWIDRNKERGQQRRLAREIWEYLGDGSRVRVVNRAGHWVTYDSAGALSETNMAWNWDGVSNPERAANWSELWIIIYPSWTFRPGTLDGLTGADGYALGHLAPLTQVDDLKRIFQKWKSAHELVRAVIWTTDATKFDPSVPASLPDGTWGQWSMKSGTSQVASGRDMTTCRFWEPR